MPLENSEQRCNRIRFKLKRSLWLLCQEGTRMETGTEVRKLVMVVHTKVVAGVVLRNGEVLDM